MRYLTFALAKGRLAKKTLTYLEKMGIEMEEMKDPDTRKLIFVNEDLRIKMFLSKASDVPTYVESVSYTHLDVYKRQWPHYVKGEGHFTALLRKDGAADGDRGLSKMRLSDGSKGMRELPEEFVQFLKDGDIRLDFDPARLILQGDHLSYLPENTPSLGKLRRMRTGWYLGDIKKKRFEPSGFFARALRPFECCLLYTSRCV